MSLENLADQAAAMDKEAAAVATGDNAAPGSPGEPQALVISNAQAFAGAIGAAREAFCFFTKLESPRVVLTDEKVGQLGMLWGPVLDKHGINLQDVMGDYVLEFTAVMGTISIVGELRAAVQAELATRAAKTKPAEPASVEEQ